MSKPKRIQQRRTKGWRKPEGVVSVARPGPWGNPFAVGEWIGGDVFTDPSGVNRVASVNADRAVAVALYRLWLDSQPDVVEAARTELAGKKLMCWCPLDEPCHADVLLEIANA